MLGANMLHEHAYINYGSYFSCNGSVNRPQMIIAIITGVKEAQANPANMIPTLTLDMIAAIHLLNCTSANGTFLYVLFPLGPFL